MLKKSPTLGCLALAALFALPVVGQEAASAQAEQAESAPMIEVAKPTKAHRVIFKELGTWEGDMTMFMGPEPIKSKCTEVNRKFGAFWMTSSFTYELNGETMRGRGQFAYRKDKGGYYGTWVDSNSDIMSLMTGEYDADAKTMTYMMKNKDPNGEDVVMRIVTTMTSETTKDFNMSMQLPDGNWATVMTVAFKKVDTPKKKAK